MSSIVLDLRGVRQAQIRGAAAAPANRAADSWRALRVVWASAGRRAANFATAPQEAPFTYPPLAAIPPELNRTANSPSVIVDLTGRLSMFGIVGQAASGV
jgi:hypothetical protein